MRLVAGLLLAGLVVLGCAIGIVLTVIDLRSPEHDVAAVVVTAVRPEPCAPPCRWDRTDVVAATADGRTLEFGVNGATPPGLVAGAPVTVRVSESGGRPVEVRTSGGSFEAMDPSGLSGLPLLAGLSALLVVSLVGAWHWLRMRS
ncbi:hypothetical protein [Amycolatopsis sp. YIM 10]|uniref:hypothetical protein n=1 Tax=Amycolatopsis sp. YIM 10 TaxID=2653857 RepID=UPI0012902210|nr:hypothetical protein [Amycolatopsis sp. YIM 10]QFU93884.1 hypothetical protein YIM_43750 [Amycolatopsis sp. YIM 10]